MDRIEDPSVGLSELDEKSDRITDTPLEFVAANAHKIPLTRWSFVCIPESWGEAN